MERAAARSGPSKTTLEKGREESDDMFFTAGILREKQGNGKSLAFLQCPFQVGMARCAVRAAFSGASGAVWICAVDMIYSARYGAGGDIAARYPYHQTNPLPRF
jgi:hypothetical protein